MINGDKMDIEQIRVERRKMENTISDAASAAMQEFHSKTGLSPDRVNITLSEATTIGERERRYIVAK